jgi:DNA-binding GntR family transcriptional regulator
VSTHSGPDIADIPDTSLAPPEQKLLSRSVADWLAARIIAGELAPGERLHETKVAEDARVSRSPVREALRLLVAEGLVELVPRAGASLRSAPRTPRTSTPRACSSSRRVSAPPSAR